jgi:hypothetical protein
MTHNSNHADLLTFISGTTALISVTSIQPYVTLVASLVAIISGAFAIRYYIKATKRYD